MTVPERPTLAVVAQALNDHLVGCSAQSKDTNRRLGRIESVLIGVAGAAIAQLLALVLALTAWIANHPHPG